MIKIRQNIEIKKYIQYLLPVFLIYLYTDPIVYLTGWFNGWNYRISELTWLFQNLLLIGLIGFALIGLVSLKQLDVFCLHFRWHYLGYLLLTFLSILGIQYGLVLLRLHLSANQSAIQDTFSRSQGDFLPYFLVLTCILSPCLEELILFENQSQTMSTSPCLTPVIPSASFIVCFLIFIEYDLPCSEYANLF